MVISVDNPGQSGIRMPSMGRLQRPLQDASDTLVPATRTPKPTESRVLPFSPRPSPPPSRAYCPSPRARASTESRGLPSRPHPSPPPSRAYCPSPRARAAALERKRAVTGAGLPSSSLPPKHLRDRRRSGRARKYPPRRSLRSLFRRCPARANRRSGSRTAPTPGEWSRRRRRRPSWRNKTPRRLLRLLRCA